MNKSKFSVTIYVTDEQVSQLKALAARPGSAFKSWQDFAKTTAALGFDERLRERAKIALTPAPPTANGETL